MCLRGAYQVTSNDIEMFADLWALMPRAGQVRKARRLIPRSSLRLFLFKLGAPLGFDPELYVVVCLSMPVVLLLLTRDTCHHQGLACISYGADSQA